MKVLQLNDKQLRQLLLALRSTALIRNKQKDKAYLQKLIQAVETQTGHQRKVAKTQAERIIK